MQELKAEISKLRIENRKQAKELNMLSKVSVDVKKLIIIMNYIL